MSVFDVHINRSPITGRIRRIAYVPGKFINADLDKASEDNERQHFLVEGADGLRIGFTQIAGLVARRILAFVREGDDVEAGQRIGLIRFGSRVDVYLPAGTAPKVAARASAPSPARRCSAEVGVDAAAVGRQPVSEDGDPRADPVPRDDPQRDHRARLCFGLTGVRSLRASPSSRIGSRRSRAIVLAGVLDGMDGRIARLLRAQSRFGAELDSLSDNIAFGTAPALILFLWSLQYAPQVRLDRRARARGLLRASPRAVQRAARCRRAAAQIGRLQHRRAGAGRGGAGLRPDLPVAGDGQRPGSRRWYVVMPWTLFIAALMISSLPTYSWSSHPDPARLAAVRACRGCDARRGAGRPRRGTRCSRSRCSTLR